MSTRYDVWDPEGYVGVMKVTKGSTIIETLMVWLYTNPSPTEIYYRDHAERHGYWGRIYVAVTEDEEGNPYSPEIFVRGGGDEV